MAAVVFRRRRGMLCVLGVLVCKLPVARPAFQGADGSGGQLPCLKKPTFEPQCRVEGAAMKGN